MIVNISNKVSVNPLHVASITVDDARNRLTVRMADGEMHSVPCQYGKSIWLTHDDLVKKMNLPFTVAAEVRDDVSLETLDHIADFLRRNP